jgi:hypothetical protein
MGRSIFSGWRLGVGLLLGHWTEAREPLIWCSGRTVSLCAPGRNISLRVDVDLDGAPDFHPRRQLGENLLLRQRRKAKDRLRWSSGRRGSLWPQRETHLFDGISILIERSIFSSLRLRVGLLLRQRSEARERLRWSSGRGASLCVPGRDILLRRDLDLDGALALF